MQGLIKPCGHVLVQELIRRKADAVNYVPEEPSSDEPGLCRILVRLPKGQKLERRFRRSEHTLKVLQSNYSVIQTG